MQSRVKKYANGFSYVIALFLVAVAAVIAVRALSNLATTERRFKEAELLEVGQAYRNAIRDYYENSPGTAKAFPAELRDLLVDERATKIRRPLRRLYRDPITNSLDWGILRDKNGGVMGVFSQSELKPMKVDGFSVDFFSFTGTKRYKDWQFIYKPN